MKIRLAAVTIALAHSLPALAGNPVLYEKPAASIAECHETLAQVAPDWRENANFKIKPMTDGREQVFHCLPDGVAEWICNPKAGRINVAVLIGGTVAACRAVTPGVPVTITTSMVPG
ncbi:hypothetical protein SAMN05892877_102342 [Rhizobium subbaraonis]|uniref:Uncharacterized protein n=1 Tax=Rhizobium subbaraonis TaxID=908946 RepID=A0A285U341_9HYPH|nr:hypothetical protein [Rhizobium subbaraonis]SOC36107.1 hypothetical protein SAMN05892877_102342 [Rhizobium subbaraonis]